MESYQPQGPELRPHTPLHKLDSVTGESLPSKEFEDGESPNGFTRIKELIQNGQEEEALELFHQLVNKEKPNLKS